MEIYTMQRPSLLLAAACAPSAPVAMPAAEWAAISAQPVRPVAVLAAERAPVSRVHQAQIQAELARGLALTDEINGTTGFDGIDVSKRYTVGGSGVPPRGRPV